MPLTPKQERFVAEYLIDLNATQAAIRAGYSVKTAGSVGSENLTKPEIKAAVEVGQAARAAKAGITADRVLEEVRRLALSDVRTLFDEGGNLRPLHELSDEQAAAVAGLEVVIKNAKAGDGQTDTIHKINVWDKPKSLEMLAKHFALLTERLEHSGGLKILHEVPE